MFSRKDWITVNGNNLKQMPCLFIWPARRTMYLCMWKDVSNFILFLNFLGFHKPKYFPLTLLFSNLSKYWKFLFTKFSYHQKIKQNWLRNNQNKTRTTAKNTRSGIFRNFMKVDFSTSTSCRSISSEEKDGKI